MGEELTHGLSVWILRRIGDAPSRLSVLSAGLRRPDKPRSECHSISIPLCKQHPSRPNDISNLLK